jgi:acyl-coenzyme A thioesterase PaaI-like protein
MVHGGALGTVIDENLGRVAIRRFPARTGLTANLNLNYRAPVYSDNFYTLHTTLDQERSTDSKGYAKCEVRDMAGRLCVEATGLFVVPKKLQLAKVGDHF